MNSSPLNATHQFESATHDLHDPNPWLALYLDTSVPMAKDAKAALLKNSASRSRQFLLPLVRPLAKLAIMSFQVLKIFVPKSFTSSRFLHELIYRGLRTWVTPEANFMILRHFNIGSQLLQFIASNMPELEIPLQPLRPKRLEDLRDNVFLQHDLNIYNFIIRLNRELQHRGIEITKREPLNFDCITDDGFGIEPLRNSWSNFIDLETAIETYTPLYQLFLSDSDFWRACNSLQLDETIAIYAGKLLGDVGNLGLVNNKHPLVPLSTLQAGYRLMLHGLAAECLHATLVRKKRDQASALAAAR